MPAPVVLVHGLGSSPAEWTAVAEVLRDAGREVLTPELPGHGARAGGAFRVGAAVGELLEAVDACAAAPVLVGRGLGGHLALQAAALPASAEDDGEHGGTVAAVAAAGIGTEVLGWVLDSYRRADATAALLPDGGAAVDAWAGDAVLDRGSARVADSRILGPALHELAQVDTLALLARIVVPFTLINGSRDRFRLQERSLLRAARTGRLVRVHGERYAERIADPARFTVIVGGLDGSTG